MGFSELGNGDLRINLRGIEAGMTEQFLDRAEVRAVLVQVRGAGVPEEMATAGLADLCRVDHAAHPVAEVIRIEPAAVAAEEERGLAGTHFEGVEKSVEKGSNPNSCYFFHNLLGFLALARRNSLMQRLTPLNHKH